jgi:hypothetical protein
MNKYKPLNLLFLALYFLAMAFLTEISAQNQLQDKVSKPWVFNYNFKEALYKTDMSFYGSDLSGLLFIKKADTSYHIVMLSELGLKFLEFELFVESGNFSVIYTVDFLSNKKVLNAFKELFQILFVVFPETKKDYTFQCSGPGNMIRVIKSVEGEFSYRYYIENGRVYEAVHHKSLKKNTSIEMPFYGLNSPSQINFQDGKIKMYFWQVQK